MTKELRKRIEEMADRYFFQYRNPMKSAETLIGVTQIDQHFIAGAEAMHGLMNEPKPEAPKEFWIAPKLYSPADPVEAEYFVAYDQPGDPARLEIHVIEKSAYNAVAKELDELEGMLEALNVERDHLRAENARMREALIRALGWCEAGAVEPGPIGEPHLSDIIEAALAGDQTKSEIT